MSQAEPPRAVLDADIIYSRVLHELMGRVADDLRLLDLVWSDDLLAEARRSLVEKKGLTGAVATRWVDYLPRNFPDGRADVAALHRSSIKSNDVRLPEPQPGEALMVERYSAEHVKAVILHRMISLSCRVPSASQIVDGLRKGGDAEFCAQRRGRCFSCPVAAILAPGSSTSASSWSLRSGSYSAGEKPADRRLELRLDGTESVHTTRCARIAALSARARAAASRCRARAGRSWRRRPSARGWRG